MSSSYLPRVLVSILALVVGGCATWESLTFSADRKYSDQTKNQTTQLYYINAENLEQEQKSDRLLSLMPEAGRDEIISAFDRCAGKVEPGVEFAPLVLLAPAAAKYVFDLAADALAGYAQDLQNRGERGYSASLILVDDDAKTLSGASPAKVPGCLVLLRIETDGQKPPKPGMVTIIRIAAQDNTLRFEPIYVRFDNAMALTERGEDGAGGRIDALYAITISVARPVQPGAYPKQVMIGVGEFSLEGVRLGTAQPALSCDGEARPCLVQTKSLDRPDSASTSVEVTVAVREIGTQVGDAKRAQAQIKAIRDAVGPKIKSAVEGLVAE